MTGVSETSSPVPLPAFTSLPDLASRALAGSVIAASDELFAQRENLIKPEPSVFSPGEFGHKGKVYDGWETRRRRDDRRQETGDWAMVRLGVPGVVHGVVVDTAWFTGNYPTHVSVEGLQVDGYPPADALLGRDWTTLVPKSPTLGDTANPYAVEDRQVWTHLRLTIYPDGGVARLRVHGDVVPDPRLLPDVFDVAAARYGGRVVGCSDMFYGHPQNMLLPGPALSMGDGWETSRRRDDGNDWVIVKLVTPAVIDLADLDTSHFKGNAPGWARLTGIGADGGEFEILPRTRLQPDTVHRFPVEPGAPAAQVRLDVYPDGGMARLRLWGRPTAAGRSQLGRRWFDALPDVQALEVLGAIGVPPQQAGRLVGSRPVSGDVPPEIARLLDGPTV